MRLANDFFDDASQRGTATEIDSPGFEIGALNEDLDRQDVCFAVHSQEFGVLQAYLIVRASLMSRAAPCITSTSVEARSGPPNRRSSVISSVAISNRR
jgi:hypothetical protein